MTGELDGYWPSRWPAEDGGPARRQTPSTESAFSLTGTGHVATSRSVFGANMIVTRDPGEVYLQGNTIGVPDTTSWVERIDPFTLEPEVRSPDLPGGPFWAGGIAAHRNGFLYITHARFCHKLDPITLEPVASCELPRPRPYNSLLILPDGHLVMKDFCGGSGLHAITNGDPGTELIVLEPDGLSPVASLVLDEGSIARLSAHVDAGSDTVPICVVGDASLHMITWDPAAQSLTATHPPRPYLTLEGQTFGWDAVIADGSAWFMDNGEGTALFGPSFRGKGTSTAPLHLVRFDLADPDIPPTLTEVCGLPNGIIANTPLVDPSRKIALAYDSSNSVMTAWRYGEARDALEPIWSEPRNHGGHLLLDDAAGLVLAFDFDHDRGRDQATILDITTGEVLDRIDTGSPVQAVLFPAPGWHDDLYTCSFTTVTRLHRP